jgi:hypothetical protein
MALIMIMLIIIKRSGNSFSTHPSSKLKWKLISRSPGKYIYHLTDSHPTETCNIKKECDRIFAQQSNGNLNSTTNGNVGSSSAGQLRNVKETIPEESIEELDDSEAMIDSEHNDTNNSNLFYFARMTNHY